MKSKFKILVIVTEFPSVTETFILNQITDLIDRGNDVTVFSYNKSKNIFVHKLFKDYNLGLKTITHFKNKGSKWEVFKEAFSFFLKHKKKISIVKVMKLLSPFNWKNKLEKLKVYYDLPLFLFSETFDIVHVHFGSNGRKIAAALKFKICPTSKAVLSFHGSDLTPSKIDIYKETYKDVFKYFDAFTINSIYLKDILLEVNPTIKNSYIIPDGFKKEYLMPFLNKHIKSTTFDIVFCGRLVSWKGPDKAIEIIKKLIDSGYFDIVLHLIGSGEMETELKKMILDLNLEKNVILYGALSQEDVFKIMAKSDVFLLPGISDKTTKRSEAQGLVLQEAQFFGLPVITSDVGGVKYGMQSGIRGFLIEHENDANTFVEKISLLYNDKSLKESIGKAGNNYALKTFESKILGDKLIEIYNQISQ